MNKVLDYIGLCELLRYLDIDRINNIDMNYNIYTHMYDLMTYGIKEANKRHGHGYNDLVIAILDHFGRKITE